MGARNVTNKLKRSNILFLTCRIGKKLIFMIYKELLPPKKKKELLPIE